MATDTAATFEESLERLDVEWTHTSAANFHGVLEAVCTTPTVGSSLPFDGVSLPEWVDDAPTPAALRDAKTGISAANIGIADYGSVVLPARPDGSEPVSLFPDTHVAVLRTSDIVPGIPEAFARLGDEFRAGNDTAIIATGPSATADMGSLVTGAHGPKDVHVVMLDE
ncbi:LutC/YkgG family protein [Halopiger thermotolerans]